MTVQSVISKIVHGVVVAWDEVKTEIENDYAKVKAALPASAAATLDSDVSALKQVASNALGMAAAGFSDAEKSLVATTEAALDAWAVSASNGLALPFVPLVNKGLERGGDLVAATVSGWLLKKQAELASNPTAPAA